MTSSDYILSWYIRVLQKNRTRPNSMYWLTRGVGLQDYGGWEVPRSIGESGELLVQFWSASDFESENQESQGCCTLNVSLKQEDQCPVSMTVRQSNFSPYSDICSIQSSMDWMRPTHIGEGTVFHSITGLNSNVNLIQKHSHRHTQNNV